MGRCHCASLRTDTMVVMDLLEKFGWSQRKAKPVGRELESGGRSDEAANSRNQALIKAGLLLALLALTVAAFPKGKVYEYTVQVGDIWRQPTLVAQFNFPIYKDSERVQEERKEARRSTPPYFEELPAAQRQMQANRDTLSRQLTRILERYAAFRYHEVRDQPDQARKDSLQYVTLRRRALVTLTPTQWRTLAEDYVERLPGLSETSREAPEGGGGPRTDQQLLDAAFQIGSQLLSVGVLNRSRDSIQTDNVIIRNEEERVQRSVLKDNVYGLNEAYNYARDQLRSQFEGTPEYAPIAFAFFRDIFQPSYRYLRAETIEERQRRATNISPIRGGVESGEIIVSKGERITEEVKRKLTSLERVRNERVGTRNLWKQMTAEALFALTTFFFLYFYIFLLRPDIWKDLQQVVIITLLMAFIVILYGIIVRVPWAQLYAVPVALASVLLTIIFNSRLGLFGTLSLAFVGGQMLGLDLEYTLATFLAGAFGVFSVRDIKNRGQFVLSAGLVFVGYLIVLTASWLYLGTPVGQFGRELVFAAVGSSFTITSYLFLWVLERTFGITTDLTLLELSDTNRPLLKELSLKAPGSFNHSLQVANLAEAAADRIGAHALLTRVGALYHDIGKMLKPEYFVENQRSGRNPHGDLPPRMSALIIASHVKEGIKKARKHNLPERVLKFIPMHHGTARIEYFYQKAIGEHNEEDSPVLESEFRYPGPIPDSKETGILMLADSVEAASRSLDDPTYKRLRSLIDLIFKERIEDGQLDDTDLTFRDLRRIKDTFLEMLLGIYHVRVKYPDQEKEEEEAAEPMLSVSQAREGDVSDVVSILYERDVWGTPEQSIGTERLRTIPGVRDPRAPRPEVAQASPHHTMEGGDGLRDVEAVEGPPSAETLRREATPRRPTALPGETVERSGNGSAADQDENSEAAESGADADDRSGDAGPDAPPSPDSSVPESPVEDGESPEESEEVRATNAESGSGKTRSEKTRSEKAEREERGNDQAETEETGAEEVPDAADPDEEK